MRRMKGLWIVLALIFAVALGLLPGMAELARAEDAAANDVVPCVPETVYTVTLQPGMAGDKAVAGDEIVFNSDDMGLLIMGKDETEFGKFYLDDKENAVNDDKQVIGSSSPTVCGIVGGSSGEYTMPKSVVVKETEVTLAPDEVYHIEAGVIGYDTTKEFLKQGCALLRYASSNLNVAKVDNLGVVTAKGLGNCVITVYASNGVRTKVKITVAPQIQEEIEYKGGLYRLNKAKTAAIFAGAAKKTVTKLTITATVKIGKKSYPVTEIAASACEGLGKLKNLTIGKNVEKIGAKAFYDCGSLKTITLKTEKLKKAAAIGANAFGKGAKKPTVKCPKSVLEKYTKWLKKKGIPKEAKFQGI